MSELGFIVGQIHDLQTINQTEVPASRGDASMVGLLLPELLCLVQYLSALHPQQQEHRDDGQQRRHRVRDDELKY